MGSDAVKRTPIERKSATKRRTTLPRCSNRQCHKPAKVQGWCATHGMREADRLARETVLERDVMCVAGLVGDAYRCDGPPQWCHVHSRSYHVIRHDPRNAVRLCRNHHAYYTHHPLEWEQWCRDRGIPWDELRIEALHGAASWSLDETLERLMA